MAGRRGFPQLPNLCGLLMLRMCSGGQRRRDRQPFDPIVANAPVDHHGSSQESFLPRDEPGSWLRARLPTNCNSQEAVREIKVLFTRRRRPESDMLPAQSRRSVSTHQTARSAQEDIGSRRRPPARGVDRDIEALREPASCTAAFRQGVSRRSRLAACSTVSRPAARSLAFCFRGTSGSRPRRSIGRLSEPR